jgi:hypothetical protein
MLSELATLYSFLLMKISWNRIGPKLAICCHQSIGYENLTGVFKSLCSTACADKLFLNMSRASSYSKT